MTDSTIQNTDVQDKGLPTSDLDILETSDALLSRWTDVEKPSDETETKAKEQISDKEEETTETEPEIEEPTEDQIDEEEIEDLDVEEDEDVDEDEADKEDDEDSKEKEVLAEDALVEVKVGDETNQVSVKELTRLYGQEKALTQKSQQLSSQKKQIEQDGLKYANALETLVKRAEERWKPYSEVDFLVASKKMEANEFQQLRSEANSAFQDYKFLTEEADNFAKQIKEQQETQNQRASPDSPDRMFAQAIDFDKADWHKKDISQDKQVLIANLHNVKEYLQQTRAEIWFDNFLHKTLTKAETGEILEWDDHRDLVLTEEIQNFDEGLQRISTKLVHEGVMLYSGVRRRNVLTDWLNSLEWDGQFRLDNCLSVYCGAKDSAFIREAGRCWLLAAVARAYNPGTKFDHVLILEGDQGIGKSTVFAVLANGWLDELNTFSGKEAAEKLDGVWIIEIAELAAMRRSDVETVKKFITTTHDRYRPAYGRHAVDKPRTCVFGGTTNSKDYLPDSTGNRRFWPIHCEAINVSGLRQDRDQLWAEAVVRYQRGESFLLSEEARTEAVEEQEERYQVDAWEEPISEYLKSHDGVTTAEILERALGIENKGQWKRGDEMRVGSILRNMGFEKRLERNGEERRMVFRKQNG